MDEYGKDGKVAWVYRHFSLDGLHSKAREEAQAAECADEIPKSPQRSASIRPSWKHVLLGAHEETAGVFQSAASNHTQLSGRSSSWRSRRDRASNERSSAEARIRRFHWPKSCPNELL